MRTNGKWLVRAGALLILMGYLMPSMLVSCTVLPSASQTISLSQIASQSVGGQPLLFLVPLGALVAITFAFLPAIRPNHQNYYLLAQVAGVGLGALSIILTLISLSSQMQQIGFSVKPVFGFFVLIAGYGATSIGIVMQFQENARMGIPFSMQEAGFGPPLIESRQSQFQPVPGPRLEMLHGTQSNAFIPVFDGFMIGRGSSVNLTLHDRSISAQHARLRHAQGSWFLQDQSTNGTFVNGQPITATRLDSGDQIRIGDTTFIFRL